MNCDCKNIGYVNHDWLCLDCGDKVEPSEGEECITCRNKTFDIEKEICIKCGSGMNLWSEEE